MVAVPVVLWFLGYIHFGKDTSTTTTTATAIAQPAGVLVYAKGPYPNGSDGEPTYSGAPSYTDFVPGTPPVSSYCLHPMYAQWTYTAQFTDSDAADAHGTESSKVATATSVDLVFDPDNLPASGRSILHSFTIPAQADKSIVNKDGVIYNLYARYAKAITSAGELVSPGEWYRVARVSSTSIYNSDGTMTITEEADRVVPRAFCNIP